MLSAADVRRLTGPPLSRVTRAHWSPSCESLSDASRGHHRDLFGNPRTTQAVDKDAIFEHGCRLMQAIHRLAQSCQITIENPVSQHFPHLPGVRMLLRDPQWRLLAGSHCSNLCGADSGLWPHKDTCWLCNRLPLSSTWTCVTSIARI